MAKTEFEQWFDDEYPLPQTIERGPLGRELKEACQKAYEAGYVAGSNAGYADALIAHGIEGI